MLDILSPAASEAKDRRRRRKDRHQRRKNPGGHKGKGCRPKSQATVCAGTCGLVKNRQTCGKTVDCGACTCDPACDAGRCETCSDAGFCVGCPGGQCCDTGDAQCVVTCPVCQACQDGACVAANEGETCGTGQVCHLGACVGNGACATGTCNSGAFNCGPSTCGADIPDPDARSECVSTVEGGAVCLGRFFAGTIGMQFTPCTGSNDCPEGQVCTGCTSLAGTWCIPVCEPKT